MRPALYPILPATRLAFAGLAAFLALAQAIAAPAAPSPVPADTAKPAPASQPPAPGMPAVLRASGTLAQPGAAAAAAETLDTADAEAALSAPAQPPAVPDSLSAAAAPRPRDTVARLEDPALVEAPGLGRLTVGGTFQLRAWYRDMFADADADKSLSLNLRRARLDFAGTLGEPGRPLGSFGFEGQFRFEDARNLGSDAVYLAWKLGDLFGIKGGKLKRPFSQESMQSSKGLYTVERGDLYHTFLANTTGYASYDLGILFHGGFVDEDVPVTYEVGLFNGKQSDSAGGYANQHYVGRDAGFKAKDLVFRLVAQPFKPLKVEAAVSTKAAEDRTDRDNFAYHVNTGYQVGADLLVGPLRILGECAWGDNHRGRDARIVSGTSLFFAFYGTAIWREEYGRGRASELVAKIEGLDPDFEPDSDDGAANDGRLRYTLGTNYFFTPKVSLLANYNLLQPITEVPDADELTHDLDVMWRLSF